MQDLKTLRDNFRSELEKASQSNLSSLPFLKNKLPEKELDPIGEYQVMVMGGTNFSSAIVRRSDSKIDLADIKKESFDLFKSSREILSYIVDRIERDVVCFNFAFPMSPVLRDNRLDGELITTSKDHEFPELIGKKIGESIEKFALENKNRSVKFSVANDSLCLLMSGTSVASPEDIVGLILGTGFNIGIFFDNSIVNVEAAEFDKFAQSEAGKYIDENSVNRGEHLFEKEVSGAYLYQHFNFLIEREELNFRPVASTQELYAVAYEGTFDKEASEAARDIFKKSSDMVAAVLAGVSLFKDHEMDVVLQGGLLFDQYRENLLDTYETLTSKRLTFYKIKDSSRIGAAYLI